MEKVKIKLEPGLTDTGQDASQSGGPYAMKLETEEGEVIIVKQEEEDDELDDISESRTSSLNKSGFGGSRVKIKSEKDAGSLLRSALIGLCDEDDDAETSEKCHSSKAVPQKFSLKVKIKEEKIAEGDSRPTTVSAGESTNNDSEQIPIKVENSSNSDEPVSNASDRVVSKTTNGNADEDRERAKNLVVSSDAAKALFKAAADIGTKAKAEKSSTIKIVFDVAGKLKEWRVESKSAEGALPASNLGKILMFANMMKNGESSSEQVAKSVEGKKDQVEKVGKEVVKPKEKVVAGKSQPSLPKNSAQSESAEPPAKKIRICEDGTSGIVDADFEGFKCKMCGKEYLHKHALTTHLKLHHLSLSGLPGSSADYSSPQASVVKVKLPASAFVATPSRTKSAKPAAPSTSSAKSPSSSTSSTSTSTFTASSKSTFSSSAATPPSSRTRSSSEKNIKYDTTSPPRPVTMVSASTMSKLGPAVPQSKTIQIKQFVAVNKPVFTDKPTNALTLVPAPEKTGQASEAASQTSVKVERSSSKSSSTLSPPNDGPYRCDLCHEEFSRQASLQGHVKSHHKEKPFMCGICDNSYLRYTDLECHLLNHSDPNPKTQVLFTCSFCEEEFKDDKGLKEHLKTHGDIEADTVFECGMCGEELKSQIELGHHMKRHMGDPFEPCKCGICLCSFSKVAELKVHLADKHFTNAQFVCDFCKCRFLTAQALKAHMPVHDKLKEAKIKIVHRWKCRQCAKRYEYKVDLVNHMKYEHKEKASFDCSFCESSFITKDDLLAHVKTHSVVAHFL
ncbi:zinc finger protein 37 homolog [Haliotis rufescens]|uniref:zinc finger protein 37 homolog n=1 Tax=Haliotis rufescens TaxID=6454 RepID=UPI00201F7974|nr:zinc finger protein 37 homolog [Haliotis rufescens]